MLKCLYKPWYWNCGRSSNSFSIAEHSIYHSSLTNTSRGIEVYRRFIDQVSCLLPAIAKTNKAHKKLLSVLQSCGHFWHITTTTTIMEEKTQTDDIKIGILWYRLISSHWIISLFVPQVNFAASFYFVSSLLFRAVGFIQFTSIFHYFMHFNIQQTNTYKILIKNYKFFQ